MTDAANGIAQQQDAAFESCGNCRWARLKLGSMHLECRRNPPTVFMLGGPAGQAVLAKHFPPVKKGDPACGEFRPKVVA